eukprot:1649356-Alexandrium_andersonii.AAC.1
MSASLVGSEMCIRDRSPCSKAWVAAAASTAMDDRSFRRTLLLWASKKQTGAGPSNTSGLASITAKPCCEP